MYDGRLSRFNRQINGKTLCLRLKMKLSMIGGHRLHRPSIDPHIQVTRLGSRFLDSGPTEFLCELELIIRFVGQREMGKVEMSHGPRGRIIPNV
jgi:hypothetical protein